VRKRERDKFAQSTWEQPYACPVALIPIPATLPTQVCVCTRARSKCVCMSPTTEHTQLAHARAYTKTRTPTPNHVLEAKSHTNKTQILIHIHTVSFKRAAHVFPRGGGCRQYTPPKVLSEGIIERYFFLAQLRRANSLKASARQGLFCTGLRSLFFVLALCRKGQCLAAPACVRVHCHLAYTHHSDTHTHRCLCVCIYMYRYIYAYV